MKPWLHNSRCCLRLAALESNRKHILRIACYGQEGRMPEFRSPLLLPQLYLLSDSCPKVNFKEKFNGKHSLFSIWICLFLCQEIYFIKQFIIYNAYVLILYYYCMRLVHVVGEGISIPWCLCGSQRAILWRWRSPSTFTWVPELCLRLSDLCGKCLDPRSHLASPTVPVLFV